MNTKKIFALILTLALVASLNMTAFAVVHYTDGTNTTWNTALEMPMNTQTMAEYKDVNQTNQHVAAGTLSPGEEHWYKILLTANSKTVLGVTPSGFTADVLDSNLNVIATNYYAKVAGKTTTMPQYVDIQTPGYYYVRLHNSVTANNEYRMHMGTPTYDGGTYTYSGSSMSLSPTVSSRQATINLTNNASIPTGSIVTQVSMTGTKSGTVSSEQRALKHATDSTFTSRSSTPWQITYAISQNKTAKSSWTFQWSGTVKTGTASYTPQIKMWYTYPVTPENF